MKIAYYSIILLCCFISCTKDNYTTTTNTIYLKDTFIELKYFCDPIKKWQKTNLFEMDRIYSIGLHDSLYTKYEFYDAYLGTKTNPSYKKLPYSNAAKGYVIKYFINIGSSSGEFAFNAFGDSTNLDSSQDMNWGTTLVFKKK